MLVHESERRKSVGEEQTRIAWSGIEELNSPLIGCAGVFGVGHVELLREVVFCLGRVDEAVGLVVC